MQDDITKLSEVGEAFDFLKDELELYTEADIVKKY
ncbi:MAG: hypothetical protein RLZZ70_62 [Candidatus Parcubacteria bacterium]|jgi:hypothetical protein